MEKQDKLTIVGGQPSGSSRVFFSTSIENLLLRAISDEKLKETLLYDIKSILNNPEFALSPQDKAILGKIPPPRLKDMMERFSIQRKTRRTFLKDAAATVALLATGFVTANAKELTTPSSVFVSTGLNNDTYSVSVTGIQYVNTIKNHYIPKEGCRFCIIEVSQENTSSEIQIYTGTFSLFDTDGQAYEYLDELGNFCLQILPPGGKNFGKLVYEIPMKTTPEKLVLYSVNTPILSIKLT